MRTFQLFITCTRFLDVFGSPSSHFAPQNPLLLTSPPERFEEGFDGIPIILTPKTIRNTNAIENCVFNHGFSNRVPVRNPQILLGFENPLSAKIDL